MPRKGTNKATGRSYEYDTAYQAQPEQKQNRAARNTARRKLEKELGPAALKGKDVNHVDGNPRNNKRSNLKLEAPSTNRARKGKK